MSDGVWTRDAQESVHKFYPLVGVGVAPIVHHLEDDREGHPFVDDAQGEDVHVGVAELPVGAVHRKVVWPFHRQRLQNQFRHEVRVNDAFGYEPLNPPKGGTGRRSAVERGCELRVCHLLHFAEGAYHHAHGFDSGEVHIFSEMGEENRRQITTFVVTLGFVTHCYKHCIHL